LFSDYRRRADKSCKRTKISEILETFIVKLFRVKKFLSGIFILFFLSDNKFSNKGLVNIAKDLHHMDFLGSISLQFAG